MTSFVWKSNYKIGHQLIDEQHQYLFSLANTIVAAKSKSDLLKQVMLLYKYVREHFNDEEALMQNINYPHYQSHKNEHDKLLDRMNIMSTRINCGTWDNSEIEEFMNSWLLDHILKLDMALSKFI